MVTEEGISEATLIKLRALRALRDHPASNENEASLAAERFAALLFKHNLDESDVNSVVADPLSVGENVIFNPPMMWRKHLYFYVAEACLCTTMTSKRGFHFIGRPSNAKAAEELAEWIGEQLDTITEAQVAPVGINTRRWRNSFVLGAVGRLGERLKIWRAEQESLSPKGMALVIRVDQENAEYVQKTYGKLVVRHSKFTYNRDAYAKGRGAANGITINPFNRTVVG